MLTKGDDYPIHQTPEPVAHPASSDRNVYDRDTTPLAKKIDALRLYADHVIAKCEAA